MQIGQFARITQNYAVPVSDFFSGTVKRKWLFLRACIALESFPSARWQNDAPVMSATIPTHVYEVRPRRDKRGVDLISDALPFGRLWYEQAPDAIEYAKFYSRSHDAVIRVYDEAGNLIETHEHTGDFKEW
jgi:hypothetical protein